MAFVDEVQFYARAGRGGDGVVRWRREKFMPKGGPCGGDGGRGGNFYIEGVRDVTALRHLTRKDKYEAENGGAGGKNSMHGADGVDYTMMLPIGSCVTNTLTGEIVEVLVDGEKILLLKGGAGGLGNEHFKSSTNQQPMQATKGKEGEDGTFHVELKLVADVGLVGLPNAGKTSLLNALTNAGAKVGDYPFTTLDPNLGMYYKYVLADIPGLIEGASEGRGLGHKFLRHITRTNVILHCISLESDTYLDDYKTVRNELQAYPDIASKKEYILLTKRDVIDDAHLEKIITEIQGITDSEILGAVTILDDTIIKEFADKLTAVLGK